MAIGYQVGVVEEDDGPEHGAAEPSRGVSSVFTTMLRTVSVIFIVVTFPLTAWLCIKVVQEYERAVIFRQGRAINKGQAKGPGILWIIPWLDIIQKVDMRTMNFDMPPQEVMTVDWVPLRVDAVLFYRVTEPYLWVTRVLDGSLAIETLAQTTLRASLGTQTLSGILAQRKSIAHTMEEILSAQSSGWGVEVERVELKTIAHPAGLHRSMAVEARATREARAKLISAQGEVMASHWLRGAAQGLSPTALKLRYLLTLPSIASCSSSTTVLIPLPMPTPLHTPPSYTATGLVETNMKQNMNAKLSAVRL